MKAMQLRVLGIFTIGLLATVQIALADQWKFGDPNLLVTRQEVLFVEALQNAVKEGDADWIAHHTLYPTHVWIGEQKRVLKTPKDFIKHYDQIMTFSVKKAILDEDAKKLFKNWRGIMLGHGEVWILSFKKSDHPNSPVQTLIIAINNGG